VIRWVPLLFCWPVLELMLFIHIGRATNTATVFALIFGPTLFGIAVVKREGLNGFRRIQQALAAGQEPGDAIVDSLFILAAGLLLIVPGLISDTVGLLLLVPAVRRWIRKPVQRRFKSSFTFLHFGSLQEGQKSPNGTGFSQRKGADSAEDTDFVDVQAREVPPSSSPSPPPKPPTPTKYS